MMNRILPAIAGSFLALSANAGLIFFDLVGTAGSGLLPGNEPVPVTGGTGGEIGQGIFFDDVLLQLTVSNVGWGSSQGFTDLSSASTNAHIHGPTANNNGNNGVANFTQTAGVLFTLTRSSSATTGGVFTNPPIQYTAGQAADLLNGKHYINLHTTNNGGGEMRGFLVQVVPEPATGALVAFGALALRTLRRRGADPALHQVSRAPAQSDALAARKH